MGFLSRKVEGDGYILTAETGTGRARHRTVESFSCADCGGSEPSVCGCLLLALERSRKVPGRTRIDRAGRLLAYNLSGWVRAEIDADAATPDIEDEEDEQGQVAA